MTTTILIVGAGAIGRGYLPWALDPRAHRFVFIDRDPALVARLHEAGRYRTYQVAGDRYERQEVVVHAAYTPETFPLEEYQDAVAACVAVGPRQVASAVACLRGSHIPLILCENAPESVAQARRVVGHEAVVFAVPDVITSNTAPPQLLAEDPLAITTEQGTLFVEEGIAGIHGIAGVFQTMPRAELLRMQWTPKLFLHNTPHCIVAYLGALMGVTYVHEAMQHPPTARLVEGAMREMLQALKLQWDIPHDFLDWYAAKELARFRCPLLFDPIARVAREPLRKLELHGRLVGAAQLCLTLGVLPEQLLKGIVGALLFEDADDPDHHIRLMREAMSVADFDRYVLGLRPGEPLDLMLRDRMASITAELRALVAEGA